jgi:oligopeptide transport system substrate-binding protein
VGQGEADRGAGTIPRLSAIVVAFVLAVSAAGCGLLSGEDGSGVIRPGGDTLNDQLRGRVSDLDPATATGPGSLTALGNVGEGLYRRDVDGEPVPGMAEGVEVSEDRLTYTFTLREDIRWSNGEPVTARDFEYAWLRAMDSETDGENADLLTAFISGGEDFAAGDAEREEVGVEATDATTLEVKLASPAPFFLDLTTLPVYLPLREQFVERWDEIDEEEDEYFADSPESLLFNGPYEMTRLDDGRSMRLEKREDYWDAESVEVGTVNGRAVPGSGIGGYESGALDVAILGPRQIPEYQTEDGFEQHTDSTTFSLYLNDEDPALDNESLRKAVQAGLDRDYFVETVLGDGSAAAPGYVPFGMSSGSGVPKEPKEPGETTESSEGNDDIPETFRAAAGDTVIEAGSEEARRYWEQGVEELGREPTLKILASHDNVDRDAGAFLQEQLEESLDAKVEVRIVPPDVLLERQEEGEYQILASRQRAKYDDPASYLDPRVPDSPLNGLRPIGPDYDKLVKDARKETDGARRTQMLVRAERMLVKEKSLVAPVFYPGDSYFVNPEVEGYDVSSYGASVDYRHVEVER